MKLAEGDQIIGVATCTEDQDFLLTTRGGKCIRFPVTDVRVFKGRDSTGVRGIKLADGDEVVSLSLLHHSDATSAEARAYLKQSNAVRRAESGEAEVPVEVEALERPVGLHEGLLRHVLGGVLVVEHVVGRPEGPFPVALHDLPEGLRVARLGPAQQRRLLGTVDLLARALGAEKAEGDGMSERHPNLLVHNILRHENPGRCPGPIPHYAGRSVHG